MTTGMVEVRAKVLKQNDVLPRSLREGSHAKGTCVVGLVSSPGSGKTAFLEKLTRPTRARVSSRCSSGRSCYGK